MPRFSIIIPVYNVEQYLRKCLENILSQTFEDFEVLCINDGSTDNSLSILEEFAQKDKRVKIFTQENQGVSVARNLGIAKAKGEYILFCDADDFYKPNLCSTVALQIEKEHKDVIAYGHENYVDGKLKNVDFKTISKIKKKNTLRKWINLQIYIWEKAFKRSFLEEHNIKFPVGIKNAEDLIFCLSVYFSGAQYSLIEEALYEYQQECNGLSTFTNPNGIENDTAAYKYFIQTEIFKKLSFKEKIAVTNFFIGGSVIYFKKLRKTEHKEKVYKDLQNLYSFVKSKYSLISRLKMKNYRRIGRLIFKEKHTKFLKYFNIITSEKEKRYVFLGIQIKFKRRKKSGVVG